MAVRRTDDGPRSFTLVGSVKGESGALPGVLVEAYRAVEIADIVLDRGGIFRGLFHYIRRMIRSDKTDRLLGSALTDPDGRFRIVYVADQGHSPNYVIVCNCYGEVHREAIVSKGSETRLSIVVKNQIKFDDPYDGSKGRMFAEFAGVGRRLKTSKLDFSLTLRRFQDFVEDWLLFLISEHAGRWYGHQGPLVPKRPKEKWPHSHTVPW